MPKNVIIYSLISIIPFFLLWIIFREKITSDPSSSIVYGFEAVLIICIYFFLTSLILSIVYKEWAKKYLLIIIFFIFSSTILFIIFNGIPFIKTIMNKLF